MGRIKKSSQRRKNNARRLVAWRQQNREALTSKLQHVDNESAGCREDGQSTERDAMTHLNEQKEHQNKRMTPILVPEEQLESEMSSSNEQEQNQQKTPELLVEIFPEPKQEHKIKGRRIVDINYLFEKIKEISRHSGFGCDIQCLDLIGEKQVGFSSKFTFICRMCNKKFFINNVEEQE